MSPTHPRPRWRPAFTTAVSAAMLAAIAGCAGQPSQSAWVTPSPVAAGTTLTATGSESPAPLAAASTGPSSSATKTGASSPTGPMNPPPGDALSQVHTAGRVKVNGNTMRYSWPGVYFEGRFRGTGVGIVLNDSAADYEVQIDGSTVATLVRPGKTTRWVNGLSNAEHRVRLVKRNDSPWSTSEFGGLVAAPGGAILTAPAAGTGRSSSSATP